MHASESIWGIILMCVCVAGVEERERREPVGEGNKIEVVKAQVDAFEYCCQRS